MIFEQACSRMLFLKPIMHVLSQQVKGHSFAAFKQNSNVIQEFFVFMLFVRKVIEEKPLSLDFQGTDY